MLVCGVDDAGRGSVLGPLVIAGISIEKNKIKHLVKIGVKDSKQLSPQSREKLYEQILSPCGLDRLQQRAVLRLASAGDPGASAQAHATRAAHALSRRRH
ncbi:MAG TPA: hypothetical protein VFV16_07945, partial [Candidatus Nitrosotalea sp.]|nr:hypothetical protein [Candidatus Nitrosotalea sp.]